MVDVLEMEERLEKFFGPVQSFSVSPTTSDWGRIISVKLESVSVSVVCTEGSLDVEVRDGMQAEIKRGCQSIEEVLTFATKQAIRYLDIQISDRKIIVARLRLHESLLLGTLN